MRLLRGELRKLIRRPATFITMGIVIGIVALIYVAVAASFRMQGVQTDPARIAERESIKLLLTFPFAYSAAIGLITGLGGLLAIAYGAAAAGADWGWGMVKVAVARGESRSRYLLNKLVAVEILLGIGLLVAFGFAVLGALAAGAFAGLPSTGLDDPTTLGQLPEHLGRGFLGIAEQGAIGFAIATFARSQLAGLGAGIALYFVEQFSTIFLPDIVKYLPFHVASSSLRISVGGGGGAPGGGAASLDPTLALGLVLTYLVVAAVASAIIVERAEISG
jgi:ABC-2 family transporter